VTKHLSHFEEGPGRVRRLTAAIVVNDRMGTEGTGKLEHAVWKPRSVDEMRRLEELAQAAVGFEAKRGDQVVIENVSFSSNVPEAAPPMLEKALDATGEVMREQPGLVKMLGAAGVIVILTLVVVRPMVRQIGAILNPPAPVLLATEAVPAVAAGEAEAIAEATKALEQPKRKAAPAFDTVRSSKQAQVVYEHVSEQIRQDPVQSTRLLKSWIGEVGEDKD